ncbi:unnamed protein product [[Actinomadura] parvosata subsp. kistnae]|uniref:Uncharacterized protein n=1 Tax=[Actinomadura] parvosata subsp. kistnae TaxID=1909395 RepID=A0A1V0AA55_9ACTN|nr:hypothetical protein [Nonomuraea sp. ATCC 55076]AQZ67059.1 hypothetical protein BKM31_41435 [Nonomuraea sp. ATCC 55076]SPL94753.1 unnamed protein product [Actinomadura parvosata subsp. kistnae]
MPSPYSLPLHALRLAGKCAMPLILWFSAGELARFVLMYAATEVAYGDARQVRLVIVMTLLTIIVLASLTVTTGMLYSLRGALWEMRARAGDGVADERFFRALDRVAPAFAVLYLAWGFQNADAREVIQMDYFHNLQEGLNDSFFGEGNLVGRGLIDLDWRVSIGAMAVTFVLKLLFAKLVEQGKGKFAGFGAAFSEFAFVFYGLNGTVAIADARSEWMDHRTVVAGTKEAWQEAQEHLPAWKAITDAFGDFWPLFLDAVAVPLAWLTVAMLVFGAYSDETRALVKGTRLERGVDRLESSHDLTQKSFNQVTGGFRDRWLPLANSLRMIVNAGLPLFGMMCLCYVALDVGGQLADRWVRTLIGSRTEWEWVIQGPPLFFLHELVVTVLTMALLAATYDIAATRARLSGRPLTDV